MTFSLPVMDRILTRIVSRFCGVVTHIYPLFQDDFLVIAIESIAGILERW